MVEEWKEHPEWKGYEASTEGRVRSWRGKGGFLRKEPYVLRGRVDKDGYTRIHLRRADGRDVDKLLHAFVIECFKGPCPPGLQVRHTPDRDRSNNRPSNLEYGTAQQNAEDRERDGKTARGARSGMNTRPNKRSYGAKNGMNTQPHRRPVGKRNGKYTKPEATPRGDTHGRTKLFTRDLPEITERLQTERPHVVALSYGVSPSTLQRFIARNT